METIFVSHFSSWNSWITRNHDWRICSAKWTKTTTDLYQETSSSMASSTPVSVTFLTFNIDWIDSNRMWFVAEFDTSRLEMGAVADLFDRNGEGLIDWQEFIAALRPDWQERKPPSDAEKIHDEVKRLVMLCTCRQKFRVFQVGEGKYRVNKLFQIYFVSFHGSECLCISLTIHILLQLTLVWRFAKIAIGSYFA